MGKRKLKIDTSGVVIKVLSYFVVTLFTIFCALPFLLILSASVSNESIISKAGFGLVPKGFTLEAYKYVFMYPKMIIGSYVVTVTMTVFGTILGLFIISMTGYALNRRDFPYRNFLSFFIYFTTENCNNKLNISPLSIEIFARDKNLLSEQQK